MYLFIVVINIFTHEDKDIFRMLSYSCKNLLVCYTVKMQLHAS